MMPFSEYMLFLPPFHSTCKLSALSNLFKTIITTGSETLGKGACREHTDKIFSCVFVGLSA